MSSSGSARNSIIDLELDSLPPQDFDALLASPNSDLDLSAQDQASPPDLERTSPTPSHSHDQDHRPEPAVTPPTGNTPNLANSEVASRQKRRVLLHAVQFHLPALAMAVFITIIYAREAVWPFSESPSAGTSQAGIQFMAQLHEALIVISLSQILLHRIRYHLLEKAGVELGLLYANFRITTPLYFFSKEFWGAARSGNSTTLATVSLALLAAVISLALSPLSAILLTPQSKVSAIPSDHAIIRAMPENFRPNASGFFEVQLPIPRAELWPLSIGPSLGVTWSCVEDNDNSCSQTASWFQQEYANIVLQAMYPIDSLPPLYSRDVNMSLSFQGYQLWYDYYVPSVQSTAVTVTCPVLLTAGVENALAIVLRDLRGNPNKDQSDVLTPNGTIAEATWGGDIPTRQPLVFVQSCELVCGGADNESLVDAFLNCQSYECFAEGLYPAFVPHFGVASAEALAEENWGDDGRLPFTFIDLGESIPHTVSTTSVSGVVFNCSDADSGSDVGCAYDIVFSIYTCIWAEASPVIADQSNFGTLQGAITRPGSLVKAPGNYYGQTIDPADIISIDADWMNSLLTVAPLDSTNQSIKDLLLTVDPPRPSFAYLVAATVAAAHCSFGVCENELIQLMNAGLDYTYTRQLNDKDATLPENQVTLRAKLYAPFTAYRFSNSWLVIAGFVFIYLHAALVLAHVAIIAVAGDCWTSNAWSDLGQFLVLAMRSPPVRRAALLLGGVNGSVASARAVWGLLVRVRKSDRVEADGGLEMVLEEEEKTDG